MLTPAALRTLDKLFGQHPNSYRLRIIPLHRDDMVEFYIFDRSEGVTQGLLLADFTSRSGGEDEEYLWRRLTDFYREICNRSSENHEMIVSREYTLLLREESDHTCKIDAVAMERLPPSKRESFDTLHVPLLSRYERSVVSPGALFKRLHRLLKNLDKD